MKPQDKMSEEPDQAVETASIVQSNKPVVQANPKPARSKRRLTVALLLLGLLVVGGVGSFIIRNNTPNSSSATTGNQPDQNDGKNSSRFYVTRYETSSSNSKLLLIDPSNKEQSTLFTDNSTNDNNGNYSSIRLAAIRNVNGVYRKYLEINRTADGKSGYSIAYQEGDNPPKTIYEVSTSYSPAHPTNYVFLYTAEDSVNKQADSITFYENNSEQVTLKRVNKNGLVTILADTKTAGSEWLKSAKPLVTAGAFSNDDKIMYLHSHSCLQCDGPSLAHVIALELSTKKISMLFSEPDDLPGGWTKLNDNTLLVTSSEWPGLGGPGSYEQNSRYKQRMYIFDLTSSKAKKVYEASHAEQMSVLGHSSDGSKVYVRISTIVKDPKFMNDTYGTPGGHEWHYEPKEIRMYDSAAGTYEILNLPLNVSQQDIQTLHSKGDTHVYTVVKHYQPFAEYTQEPTTLYSYTKGAEGPTELLKATEGYIAFRGFEHE